MITAGTLLSRFAGQPWAMHRDTLNNLAAILTRRELDDSISSNEILDIVAARDNRLRVNAARPSQTQSESGYTLHGSVAHIPIVGVIARHASQVNDVSQPRGTGCDAVRAMLNEALGDERVGSILLHVDSPGGSCAGLELLSDDLAAASETKPVWAHAESMIASAALWLGVQALRLTTSRDTMVGSIGVYAPLVDYEEHFKAAGIKVEVRASNEGKGDGHPGTPMTDNIRAETDDIVGKIAETFLAHVARGRDMPPEAVKQLGPSRVWLPADAMAIGLIDAIVDSVDKVVADMNQQFPAEQPPSQISVGTGRATAHTPPAAAPQGDAPMPMGSEAEAPAGAGRSPEQIAREATQAFSERLENLQVRAGQAKKVTPGSAAEIDRLLADASQHDSTITLEAFSGQLMNAMANNKATKPSPNIPPNTAIGGDDQKDKLLGQMGIGLLTAIDPGVVATIMNGGDNANKVAQAVGFDSPDKFRKARAGIDKRRLASGSIKSMAAECVAAAGGMSLQAVDNLSDQQLFAQAFGTTSDLPNLLSNIATKAMAGRAMDVPTYFEQVARIGSAPDYKEMSIITLGVADNLELIPENGEVNSSGLTDRAEGIKVDPFAREISYSIQAFVNDDLSGLAEISQKFADSGARVPDRLITALLAQNSGDGPTLTDGSPLISTARGNKQSGTAALSYDVIRAGQRAMRSQKDFGNEAVRVSVEPTVLLTSNALSSTAEDLTEQEYVPGSAVAGNPQRNTLRGRIRSVYSAYLDDVSQARYWLFGNPNQVEAFRVNFISGQRNVQMHTHVDGSPLATKMTFYHPGIGAAAVNPQGIWSGTG
ncbi:MAG: S49 family peptidase [Planctomycetota bacterium]